MTRSALKHLVIASYSEGSLDPEKVNKIADLLSRKELKLYIKALKNWEKQQQVLVDVPQETPGLEAELHSVFPDKQIVLTVDPSLILGMRMHHNDDIYEMSLNNTLEKITEHIEEHYD